MNKKKNRTTADRLKGRGLEPGRIDMDPDIWSKLEKEGKEISISKKKMAESALAYLFENPSQWDDLMQKAKKRLIEKRYKPVR